MKGIQSLRVLRLLPGLPLFQIDQAVDMIWSVCENSLVMKSEANDPAFNQAKIFFQLKNPLSILLSSSQGTSPFWRSPPDFHPVLT
jgi:hypothetical protein